MSIWKGGYDRIVLSYDNSGGNDWLTDDELVSAMLYYDDSTMPATDLTIYGATMDFRFDLTTGYWEDNSGAAPSYMSFGGLNALNVMEYVRFDKSAFRTFSYCIGETQTTWSSASFGCMGSTTVSGKVGNNFPADAYVSDTPSSVPVPSAVLLFGSGLLGLVDLVRRKKA